MCHQVLDHRKTSAPSALRRARSCGNGALTSSTLAHCPVRTKQKQSKKLLITTWSYRAGPLARPVIVQSSVAVSKRRTGAFPSHGASASCVQFLRAVWEVLPVGSLWLDAVVLVMVLLNASVSRLLRISRPVCCRLSNPDQPHCLRGTLPSQLVGWESRDRACWPSP